MKKYLFLALGVAALTSCSSDEVTELNEGNEIKFAVVADNDSRAADVWCNNNLMPNFVLFAQEGNNAFINAETYSIVEGTTTYNAPNGITRYWPESGKLDFYAIYGLEAGDLKWTPGQPPTTNEITINSDVQQQVDYVYAVKPGAEKTADGKVTLNFRHALSQIEFQAKNGNPDELKIQILDVRVGKVFSKGTLTLPTETTDKNVQNHDADNGQSFTSQTGIWGSTVNTLATFDITAANFGNAVTLTADAKPLTISKDAETVGEVKNNSMLLLPQSRPAWGSTEDTEKNGAFLAVKCKIYNVVKVGETDQEVLLYGGTEGRWAYVPVAIDWAPGYKYIYTFNFADGTNAGYDDSEGDVPSDTPVLVKLSVNVTVDDFEPKDPTDTPMEVK